jgi:pyroglutamyl-peptidase
MKQPRNALGQNRPVGRSRPARPVRVLLTGFGPFPGVPVNPTAEIIAAAARRLAHAHAPLEIDTEVLPTEWAMLARLPEILGFHRPDVVIMTGVAVRARSVRLERTAHARADAALQDAAGAKLIVKSGIYAHRSARRTEVDADRLKSALFCANLRVSVSDDPGRYLCNAAYLTALDWAARRFPRPPVVFVHVPPPRLAHGARGRDLVDTVVEVGRALASGTHRRGVVRPRTFPAEAGTGSPSGTATGQPPYFRSRRGS